MVSYSAPDLSEQHCSWILSLESFTKTRHGTQRAKSMPCWRKADKHSGLWACSSYWQINDREKNLFVCVREREKDREWYANGRRMALCLHLSPPLLPESSYCQRRAVWVAMATVVEWDGKGWVKMNSGALQHPNNSTASQASLHTAAALAKQLAFSSILYVFLCLSIALFIEFVSISRHEMNQ